METRERLGEFLKTMKKKAIKHRRIARELTQAHDKLDDTKFHDGRSAMADELKVEYEILFSKELKQ